jgi:hypothetical protein
MRSRTEPQVAKKYLLTKDLFCLTQQQAGDASVPGLKYRRSAAGQKRSPGIKFLAIDDHLSNRNTLPGVLKKLWRGTAIFEASDGGQRKRFV